jgi:hypothetical protein
MSVPGDADDLPDGEGIQESADNLEDMDEDVSGGLRTYARAYVTGLFFLIAGAFAVSVYLGFIDFTLTLTADVAVGWVVEYLVIGVVGAFLLFTFAMVLISIPASFTAALVRFAGGIVEAGQSDDE